jgi:hypothetical protein
MISPHVLQGLSLSLSLSPALYALVRVGTRALAPEPDPLAALSTSRSVALDRLSLTLYATALCTAATVAIARRWPSRVDALSTAFVALSSVSILAQAALAP